MASLLAGTWGMCLGYSGSGCVQHCLLLATRLCTRVSILPLRVSASLALGVPASCVLPLYAVPLVVHRRRLEVLRMARRLSHVLFVLLAVSCSATATLATFGSVHGAVLAFGVVLVGVFLPYPAPPSRSLLPPPPPPPPPPGSVDWSGSSIGEPSPSQVSPDPGE